jgi:hypothetical protein
VLAITYSLNRKRIKVVKWGTPKKIFNKSEKFNKSDKLIISNKLHK